MSPDIKRGVDRTAIENQRKQFLSSVWSSFFSGVRIFTSADFERDFNSHPVLPRQPNGGELIAYGDLEMEHWDGGGDQWLIYFAGGRVVQTFPIEFSEHHIPNPDVMPWEDKIPWHVDAKRPSLYFYDEEDGFTYPWFKENSKLLFPVTRQAQIDYKGEEALRIWVRRLVYCRLGDYCYTDNFDRFFMLSNSSYERAGSDQNGVWIERKRTYFFTGDLGLHTSPEQFTYERNVLNGDLEVAGFPYGHLKHIKTIGKADKLLIKGMGERVEFKIGS